MYIHRSLQREENVKDSADIVNADIEIADAFIHLANEKLEAGFDRFKISAAMVHAAANFSAFAYANGNKGPLDNKRLIQEFHQLLLGYDDHHRKRLKKENDKV